VSVSALETIAAVVNASRISGFPFGPISRSFPTVFIHGACRFKVHEREGVQLS